MKQSEIQDRDGDKFSIDLSSEKASPSPEIELQDEAEGGDVVPTQEFSTGQKMMPDASEIDIHIQSNEKHLQINEIHVQEMDQAQPASHRSDLVEFKNESPHASSTFQKSTCYGPTCTMIRSFFKLIGGVLALVNAVFDIAYFAKAPYYSKLLFTVTASFLALRFIVVFGISQCYFAKFVTRYRPAMSTAQEENAEAAEEDGRVKSQQQEEIRGQGISLYLSYHVLFYTGFYRFLPSLDFRTEVILGYAMELLLSLFPMLFVQMFNNSAAPAELHAIQQWSLTFKTLQILNFLFELAVVIWAIRLNKKMRKLQIKGFEKKPEEERRRLWSKKASSLAVVASVAFTLILVLSLAISKGRACQGRYAMEWGTCAECQDPACMECWDGAETCGMCRGGYTISKSTGKCLDCDNDRHGISCLSCTDNGDASTTCNQCARGYLLHENKCKECDTLTNVDNCQSCDIKGNCLQCQDGYLMAGKKCVNCANSEGLDHCALCREVGGKTACDRCNDNIASFDSSGKRCLNCQSPWRLNSAGDQCECPEVVNAKAGYKCQTCSQLMPGCGECEYTTNPAGQLAVNVGWDPLFSGKVGQYAKGQVNSKEPEFVKCTKAGPGLIRQKVGGKYVLRRCSQEYKGCKRCREDGSACEECENGQYLIAYGSKRKTKCIPCRDLGTAGAQFCEECTAAGCTRCQAGAFGKWGRCVQCGGLFSLLC